MLSYNIEALREVEFWIIYFWISTSWISTFIPRVTTLGMRQIWAQCSSTIIINLGSIECDFSSRQERLEAIESIIWEKVANWPSHSALTTLHLVSKYPIKMADSTGGHHLFLFCTSHLISPDHFESISSPAMSGIDEPDRQWSAEAIGINYILDIDNVSLLGHSHGYKRLDVSNSR